MRGERAHGEGSARMGGAVLRHMCQNKWCFGLRWIPACRSRTRCCSARCSQRSHSASEGQSGIASYSVYHVISASEHERSAAPRTRRPENFGNSDATHHRNRSIVSAPFVLIECTVGVPNILAVKKFISFGRWPRLFSDVYHSFKLTFKTPIPIANRCFAAIPLGANTFESRRDHTT